MVERKPSWLNKKIDLAHCREVGALISDLKLNTVCHKALCPNIGECFVKKHATFLILGNLCTRGCKFCGVTKKTPLAVDLREPERVAEAASRLGLRHIVITSVTRDDLPDGGAEVFARTVLAIRNSNGDRSGHVEYTRQTCPLKIELLIPDLQGDAAALKTITDSKPDIIGHNIETVPSLYKEVRLGASYERSLGVIKAIKKLAPEIYSKSGIMLGLGEREEEVLRVFKDLRSVGCDFISIGQYLRPSKEHYPVKEYIDPEKFEYYKEKALEAGFKFCASGPYVRSSYLASEYLERF
jgi:lipoic acid synthetase